MTALAESAHATPDDRASGLYIHIPFCSAICPYCDFAVVTGASRDRTRYLDHLVAEIELYRGHPGRFDTIYFGGGTPSDIGAEDLERILEACRGALDVAPDAWISLEANPEDVVDDALEDWRALGVRTVSLGVQSFDDGELGALGRRHDGAAAIASVRAALDAGLDVVSIDLIYGLPPSFARGEPLGAWQSNLEQAIDLRPDHLSCYQLTIHEGTPFARYRERGSLEPMPEREQAEAFELTHRLLGESGYEAYEVSNFARSPAHRSLHNQRYWDHTPYLGLGMSAHSFDGARRWWNERRRPRYEQRLAAGERPVEGSEELGPRDLALETVMLGLRTTRGVDLGAFRRRFGADLLDGNADLLARYREEGLVEDDPDALRLTRRGLAVADAVARELEIPVR